MKNAESSPTVTLKVVPFGGSVIGELDDEFCIVEDGNS
jgi:hypothetical protein